MTKAKKDKADVYLAVLDYRNTPTQGSESSPSQRQCREVQKHCSQKQQSC